MTGKEPAGYRWPAGFRSRPSDKANPVALFKQQTTKPIPADAVIETDKTGQCVARFRGSDGRMAFAPLTANGDRIRIESKCWHGEFRTADGVRHRVRLFADKEASKARLLELTRKAERQGAGLADPVDDLRKLPLADHLQAFEERLTNKGNTASYVAVTVQRIRTALDVMGAVRMGELTEDGLLEYLARIQLDKPTQSVKGKASNYNDVAQAFGVSVTTITFWRQSGAPIVPRQPTDLAELAQWLTDRRKGASAATANHVLTALKMFTRWLHRKRGLPRDPFASLGKYDAEADRRRERRSISAEELARLLETTRRGDLHHRYDGPTRALIYLMAARLGFRRGDFAGLTVNSFDWSTTPPSILASAKTAKNRKNVTLPMTEELANYVRGYLESHQNAQEARRAIFPGFETVDTAEMLRVDLEAAGIPYVDVAGRVFDFHALRGQFASDLARAGVPLATAQKLMRHGDPRLTANVYTTLSVVDLGAAIDRLPETTKSGPEETETAMKATGTDPIQFTGQFTGAPDFRGQNVAIRDKPMSVPIDCHTSDNGTDVDQGKPPSGDNRPAVATTGRGGKKARPAGFEPATFGFEVQKRKDVTANAVLGLRISPDAVYSPVYSKQPVADGQLAEVVDAWPDLPEHIRSAILTLAKGAKS